MRTGDAYAFTGLTSGTTNTTSNGLNQQVMINGATVGWDTLGNLTSDPTSGNSYTYDVENKLKTAVAGGVTRTLSYDPLNRLNVYNPGTLRRFVYDGLEAAAELDSSGAIQNRYVMGDGPDEVLVDYSGIGYRALILERHSRLPIGEDITWTTPGLALHSASVATFNMATLW